MKNLYNQVIVELLSILAADLGSIFPLNPMLHIFNLSELLSDSLRIASICSTSSYLRVTRTAFIIEGNRYTEELITVEY
ncbi:hypothetical protein FIV31_02445 [Coxiella endosymbiont of Ornithodoros amblus]|uniref:hypothetical protein n=1 Tax=Coxiella endosymbiont of Ornithodoros amblus TaxID=1656166 RepID=UPI00244DFFC8|nr:hypothetical protein [Coxiella endosymbiont of Ornithodoros amblus]MBW5802509.1 hypothetical protein [Coxiella endosymbiont of Ornithodoros amblus]